MCIRDSVFCGHPSMGSGGGFGGRQQARNGACSLIFTKRKKKTVAGISSGATALKIGTACRRDALLSEFAVVSVLKYIKYLECHGFRRSGRKLRFRVCFRPLSDRRWSLFHFLSRTLSKSPFLYEKCDFSAPAEMPPKNRRPSRNRDAGAC